MAEKLTPKVSVFLLLVFVWVFGTDSRAFAQNIEVKSHAGIQYMSGGIGLGEREQMLNMKQDYNLKLIFAVQEGNFLADVNVRIMDNSGDTLLDAVSDGPWFYAKVPAGAYTIAATTLGQTIRKVARVGAAGRAQVSFVWTK